MTATDSQYLELLQNLLPRGGAWPRDAEASLTKVLHGLAGEPARGHNRALDTIEEADPRTTLEQLDDWERVAGLPDPCLTAAQTLQGRRAALVARLTSRGGQSRAYYIALAAALGYDVTITEFDAFSVGSLAGDAVTNTGTGWEHTWRMNGPEATVEIFLAGESLAGEGLRSWGNEELECAVAAKKPAHTILQFAYLEFLYLNFTGLTFPSEVSFSRASIGYYTNSDGTLTAFASGAPRFGDRGLLIEEARTNIALRSQEFNTSPWSASGSVTITPDDATAPDGTDTADRFVSTAPGHYNLQDITVPDDTMERRISCFFKYDDSTLVQLVAQYFNGGTSKSPNIYFNPQTGVITSDGSDGSDAKVTMLANGWYRVDFSATNNGTGNTTLRIAFYPNTGSGQGVYVWGLGVEAGAFVTSYIKTEAAAVERERDVAAIDDIEDAAWNNPLAGTIMAKGLLFNPAPRAFATPVSLNDGTANESITVMKNGTVAQVQFSVLDGGAGQFAPNSETIPDGTPFTAGIAYEADNIIGATDGVLTALDTSATIPAVNRMEIGARAGGQVFNGYIQEIKKSPRRLPDEEFREMTL